ncbi:MAG: hypothetical protein LC792_17550 [Actinobacteria bacterium]|nr:hypothetical protein [Actinomycetota bacterium]
MRPLDLSPDGLAELAAEALEAGAGGWSMGVQGALAEFALVGDERPEVRRSEPGGRTVEAVTAGGGIRLTITDETVAYEAGSGGGITLAVPRTALPAPSLRVTAAPADPAALRPEDEKAALFDLAVGHSAAVFCVRTADPDLIAALRAVEGWTWLEVLDGVGHRLVAASPHRVVIGPLGRIEVYNPIPPAHDVSPDGCHTHLLPRLLETGRETAPGVELPPQLVAAANWTNPGWGRSLTFVKLPPT